MATFDETKMLNEAWFERVDSGRVKNAADAVDDYTRTRLREDGFLRRGLLPPTPISNSELDRQYDTDDPVKVVDKEPDSPAAIGVPFNTLPMNVYIRGLRYRVMFARIQTVRFIKDVDQLRTYNMDIRQVLSDNSIKDALAEEDGQWITTTNLALIGQDQTVPLSGVSQWQTIPGGITRESWEESLKILPRTPFHLEAATVLMNNVTVREFMKWGRDEMGGDKSQELLWQGWSDAKFEKKTIIVTIKRDLVPDDTMFQYADPKFVGKFYELEMMTMYLDRKGPWIEWYNYESIGATLGHSGSCARADFV